MITISNVNKIYDNKFQALKEVNFEIQKGEIFALLGPNGAGKTTLIKLICGLTNATSGAVTVDGLDIVKNFRQTRKLIGLVPQELTTSPFETVWNTVSFSRGLFGKAPNPGYIEKILKQLSLWDKKDNKLMTLSGGMKRRVMIAKALSHEPRVLFLDEPTAGVDVELRKDMWQQVRELKETGVTIILTTHYIEEAEEMADRVGVISSGKIILIEEKNKLMKKMSKKEIKLVLGKPLSAIPSSLSNYDLKLTDNSLIYSYGDANNTHGVSDFFEQLKKENIEYTDIKTHESSLEEIFVELVNK